MSGPLCTLEDVADYLGASTPTNDAISRRVYKDTSCGAWAKVVSKTKYALPAEEEWTGRYAKIDGVWERRTSLYGGVPVEFSEEPDDVRDYFWHNDGEGMQEYLDGAAAGQDLFESAETFKVRRPLGKVLVFRCGSIVEGTEAEITASDVELPCRPEEIDEALGFVEDEAEEIWNSTHGCHGCAGVSQTAWEAEGVGTTPVNPECPECGGEGVCI